MKKRPSLSEVHKNVNFDIEEAEDNNSQVAKELESLPSETKPKLVDIPVSKIDLDQNIRDVYSDDSLEELGDSILENGQIQPIVVTKKGSRYVVKVGHRRFKACYLRKVPTVKCIIEDDFKSERERIIIQAIENEQRLNLSSREREAYISRLTELGMTQTEIAKALHKTKGWVSEAVTSYNFVNENKELFDELKEEPSTRDTWKASTLSEKQLKDAISETKKQGGTKDVFKKEVDKLYNQNKVNRKVNKIVQKLTMSTTLSVNWEDKIIVLEKNKYYDENLAGIILNDVRKYYEKKGFKFEV